MPLIDTHVHIDFYPYPNQIADSYEKNRIYTLFVTNLPELYEKHQKAFNNYKYVRLCLGYHPQVASDFEFKYQLFEKYISDTRYIGEVGLDYKEEFKEIRQKQYEIFDFVTSPHFSKGRVYSVHSNHSEDDVLKVLVNNNVKHAILHWYSGKLTTLDKFVDNGYYFSINPKMLLTKSGQKAIERIPKNLLLFETDGPFVRFNKKIIYPKDISNIYMEIERFIPDFKEIVFKNFKRLLIEKDLS
ncbi:TatD family hydrolase [Paraliobacillus salinarum]|uniref:TatD family hydrolase n=1 Tax=Paraliobacillus salinarum TaxID=1158996 RepID=UPI0015F44998|nr:TatD family hydrolase [Paraliobacillus salinarum]